MLEDLGNGINNHEGKWTWEVGEKKSLIDYLLFSRGMVVGNMATEDSVGRIRRFGSKPIVV